MYIFKNITEWIFSESIGKKVTLLHTEFALNFCALIAYLVWLIQYCTSWSHVNSSELPNGDTSYTHVIIMEHIHNDTGVAVIYPIAICIGIQWFRAIFSLQISRQFGPVLKIVAIMLIDVAKFMVIFGITIFIFACVALIGLNEIDIYGDLW